MIADAVHVPLLPLCTPKSKVLIIEKLAPHYLFISYIIFFLFLITVNFISTKNKSSINFVLLYVDV